MGRRTRKQGKLALVAALVVGAAVVVAGPSRQRVEAAPEAPPLPFDFDGDGDEELVIGVPGKSFGYFLLPPLDKTPTHPAVGWIQVLNGDSADSDPEYTIDQSTLAGHDEREAYDEYGYTFVGGDFNGDGYSDLAAGVPAEDLTGPGDIDLRDAGAVEIYYGSSSGLQRGQGDFSQFLHRGSAPVGDTLHSFDRFGEALTPGDFDGDGYTDLAIGVPLAELGQIRDAGSVDILFGSADGLGLGSRPTQRLDRTQWADNTGDLDRFGSNLTTGDFNGDGVDDLAVGSQSDPADGLNAGGFVEVLYGTSTGISVESPAPGGIAIEPRLTTLIFITLPGERFGWDLEAGDFDNDGDDELAIGVPRGDGGGEDDAGRVHVFEGSPQGLEGSSSDWHQNEPGVEGGSEPGDQFGHSLAVGYFDDDDYADLAIGVPGEAIGTETSAGAVNVIYGSATGLDVAAAHTDQFWHQDIAGINGAVEPGDQFGKPLVAADYDGDGRHDLGVGTHSEDLDKGLLEFDSGSVQVIFGAATGLTATGDRQVYPGNGALSFPAWNDFFGSGLDGQGLRELWIIFTAGAPSAIRNVSAVAGDERIVLGWTAPVDPGGRPITGYVVEWAAPGEPPGSAETTGTDFVIEGLGNGATYEIAITAKHDNPSGTPAVTSATPRPALRSISPARLLESRVGPDFETVDGQSEGIGRVAAGSITEVVVAGRGGVPGDAVAVMGNLTAVLPAAAGFLTIFACGGDPPNASNVNYGPGDVAPNAVLAPLDDDGNVCVFSLAETDLLFDVNGYVPDTAAPEPIVPIRLYESRIGPDLTTFDGQQQGTGRRPAGSITKVKIDGRDTGVGGFPNALFVNVTAVNPAAAGFLTVHSCDTDPPLASHVNYGPGDFAPNAVLAPFGQADEFCIFTLAETDLIVDLNGFVPGSEQPLAVTPARLLETRVGPNETTVDGQAEGIGRRGAGTTYELLVTGRGGVSDTATSVLLNVTAIGPSAAGFLTVFPCGDEFPLASNVNYGPGDVAPNAVLAKVGVGGKVCIYTLAETDLIADVSGYVG